MIKSRLRWHNSVFKLQDRPCHSSHWILRPQWKKRARWKYNQVLSIALWCDEYEGVESESRASRTKIYDTFDRSAVKIHRRAFVSCSRAKACNFCGFVNISSETFLEKLSPLNELLNQWRSMRKTTSCKKPEKIFLANQKRAIQTLLELVR